jgi:D-tyrosyl-tRNA(Tyr) deacylase
VRVLLQRVRSASVSVGGDVVGAIGQGLLLLVGVAASDGSEDVRWCADKVAGLRIFSDADGRMNLSVHEVGGAALSVSQFTLYADVSRGRRPGFSGAAPPDRAEALWREFNQRLAETGIQVETGRFRADMQVALVNDGPVTIWVDSAARGSP